MAGGSVSRVVSDEKQRSVVRPAVDVVVAVHTPERPVERAVGSVVGHNTCDLRVTVVCHDTPLDGIRHRLAGLADDPRVRLVEHLDGVRSPAGPFNKGLELASADFTSVMGSDDVLRPGAVDSWLARQRADGADVVITRLEHASGRAVPTPPVRPWRRSRLDGARDRLAYRSAPLGLVSRERFGHLRFTPGVAVGEDIEYVLALWFSGASISFDRAGPAYVINDDAGDRVTFSRKPVAAEFAFLPAVLAAASSWSAAARRAYAVKFLRVQVFGAVLNRPEPSWWTREERDALRDQVRAVLAVAPGAAAPLSLADRRLLDAVLDPGVPASVLVERARARRRFGRPETVLTRAPHRLLDREAPIRFMISSLVAQR